MAGKKDNSTFNHKLMLHRRAIAAVDGEPVILETHGGNGRVGERCFDGASGLVIDKDAKKAKHLAKTRPHWRVYQGDSIKSLKAGLGAEMMFNFISCDPYGQPFPTLEAIFHHPRNLANTLHLVVNDGLRKKIKIGGAWTVASLESVVLRRGNDLYHDYLAVAHEVLENIVEMAGFRIENFNGYYCGHNHDMTHYWAMLKRDC